MGASGTRFESGAASKSTPTDEFPRMLEQGQPNTRDAARVAAWASLAKASVRRASCVAGGIARMGCVCVSRRCALGFLAGCGRAVSRRRAPRCGVRVLRRRHASWQGRRRSLVSGSAWRPCVRMFHVSSRTCIDQAGFGEVVAL
ncbi:hypothetical protein WS83_28825 [Burkholderia sp. MSMB2042]|nr:hypothetical protein WS78_18885 [Burkholderia savannae]KVG47531.1 hypothetical protein WS77_05180 [Burkholderia sp. MSMB0265]KVG82486.1 hypothetical protein WS81_01745 [Burkholderia sp. MSMB2040]KVG92727.1 hypothetical protein WS82_11030 [Burkholderia sp. MSMB2041]KVG98585.1 hypothetical protein WS83_28825 [Burkholderia sp. MSMB2042]